MANITAKVATALRIVAIQMTSKPRMWGPVVGTCCMDPVPPSDLEVDHFGHDPRAQAHPDDAADAGDLQPLVGEEPGHVMGVDHPHEREDDERQRADDIG